MIPIDETKSTSDNLAANGFGNRPPPPDRRGTLGKRIVFRLGTEEVVGSFDCFQANDFLRQLAAKES